MRNTQSESDSEIAYARRLDQLTTAFAAYRRASRPGQRVPHGLRSQVVAALDAGVSGSAIGRACRLSWSQLTRWQAATRADARAASVPAAQVLSVVDSAPADGSLELRVGAWRICVSRASE